MATRIQPTAAIAQGFDYQQAASPRDQTNPGSSCHGWYVPIPFSRCPTHNNVAEHIHANKC